MQAPDKTSQKAQQKGMACHKLTAMFWTLHVHDLLWLANVQASRLDQT